MNAVLHHVGLTSRNPEATAAVLVALFGAEKSKGPGHDLFRIGALQLAVVPWREGDPLGHSFGEHLAFQVTAAERASLLARVEALQLASQDVHGRLYVRDADGLTFEFLFDDPAAP
ncbi:MAG: hypothetical protein GQE15_06790 [Archangiaceae bacterium]|nr:hypothetical protein [Archangiaceae bacterium]